MSRSNDRKGKAGAGDKDETGDTPTGSMRMYIGVVHSSCPY